ncbi:MAG: peptidase T [Paludibacteraceae bacterium]|nr:peptidase T [Paludibacteraceae bacterium]
MNIVERFLKYVSFTTTSDENTGLTPSTLGQMIFAQSLQNELKNIGLSDVTIDENGYVMATLPSNSEKVLPTIGFIAHMDTSPEMTAKHITPNIIKNYNGENIVLNAEDNINLSPKDFPELKNYIGQDLIVTNGKTLLGADDKAGIAEIVTAMEYLINHPEEKHGTIKIAFTPDEEIGQGAQHFNVEKFNADWAYTIDGGEIGELEYENFNAAVAKITFFGRNVHPGYAKHKMLNSIRIGQQFASMLPRHETPEHTEDYEGFYHLISFEGSVEKTTLHYIIRDHDKSKFESRKKEVQHLVNKIAAEFGKESVNLEIKDQYYNMREKIEPSMHIIDLASKAMQEIGIEPKIKPIRGGTDGAQLSFKGLPCPNIFTGGHNFHGRYEYIPIQSMEKAMQVIIKIATLLQ